ncbi:NACHT domain-containing protein [Paractinoplanes maris]|uniref:NACHT domain-containing protein n=1 Tax=Paractinoplanes maris TaxID=1734446 RepID=UPI0020228FCA|nr:AAA family ATPase [Actinoplanes maris]
MAKTLTYRDAVKILGGAEGGVVDALDSLTAGLMLGGTVTFPALLGWFDARAEFARLSRRLVGSVRQRSAGSHRLGRTAQLEAAHTVLVVAAFFEVLGEASLPVRFSDIAPEQLAIAARAPVEDGRLLVADALATAVALPVPHQGHDDYLAELEQFYAGLAKSVLRFVSGLAAWEALPLWQRGDVGAAVEASVSQALQRYSDFLLDLVKDFPEVGYWAGLREHRSTTTEVREVKLSLQDMSAVLARLSSRIAPVAVRETLHRGYAAALDRAITESADVPEGMTVPTLAEIYIPPPFRVTGAPADAVASDEAVWAEVPVRDDLDDYLVGHLTSPGAVRAPMLMLGQPGAGKSVLTKVLSARLPAADFLPIRVVLREVDATKDVQGQIEDALRSATSESLRWRDIAQAADGALPVVLLDGFDELLQATGVSQSNYLMDVLRFQEREREQGRAVAFVVTTRTSVADRARTPPGTVVLRLEPFDGTRARRWLDVWNATNDRHFRTAGLRPLPAGTVLGYPELAGQPLLLLLLALYDADGNALQRERGDLSLGDLYERLLRAFARREARRQIPRAGSPEVETWIDGELRNLSIAAFAMFNRSSQWVTHADLEDDLSAVLPPKVTAAGSFDALQESALLVGRFFFVHRTQATRRDTTLHTYEFLHATFGEYLVARLTWALLRDAGARNTAGALQFGGADDAGLYRFLSFAVLSVRTPTITFLVGMAKNLEDGERRHLGALLGRLYTAAPYEWRPDSPEPQRTKPYQPARLPIPIRIAVYTANLTLLAVVVAARLAYSDLYHPREWEAAEAWHGQALLWHSQLRDEEWDSLVELIAVERCWIVEDGERDVRLTMDFGATTPPPPDPHWTFARPATERGAYAFTHGAPAWLVKRRVNFVCGSQDDVLQHALGPLLDSGLEVTTRTFVSWLPSYPTAAEALLTVLLLPTMHYDDDRRRAAYLDCARIAAHRFPPWDDETQNAYGERLFAALAGDDRAGAGIAAEVLSHGILVSAHDLVRHLVTVLKRTGPSDPGYGTVTDAISRSLQHVTGNDTYHRLLSLLPDHFADER